ncbi:hypothetical protein [Pseudonocardia ammonioxydans]|nr:hypothetical protein [Pseudonocardia ammonioxydans]
MPRTADPGGGIPAFDIALFASARAPTVENEEAGSGRRSRALTPTGS